MLIESHNVAKAVTFNFSFADGTPQTYKDAFEQAGDLWAAHLQDDVTINVDVSFGEITDGIVGTARPAMVRVNYTDVLASFDLDQTSADDTTAFNYLPTIQANNGGIKRQINKTATNRKSHKDKSVSNLWLTRANAKSLGIIEGNNTTSDGQIRLSNSVHWDLNASDDIASDHYDFVGTAAHELGHVLGVISGVDVLDFNFQTQQFYTDQEYDYITTMDLFRHSDKTKGKGKIDFRLNKKEKYFSVNGGTDKIAEFSNGLSTGGSSGGYQASHWKVGLNGIMQPSVDPGERNSLQPIDLRLMDAIGWDLVEGSGINYLESSAAYTIDEDSFDAAISLNGWVSYSSGYNFWQQGLASTSGKETATSVPEPNNMTGLGAMFGLFGFGWLRKLRLYVSEGSKHF